MLLRMHYIDFIDRMYILQLLMISKRVEGNAGQILDEAPKNKPYSAMKAEFFSAFKLAFYSDNSHVLLGISYSNA